MSSGEIAKLYGSRAVKLDGRIEFAGLYTDVALRHETFAGLDFTVYFQMGTTSHKLAQVMLERRRQYASLDAWREAVAALERQFGPATKTCDSESDPQLFTPAVRERIWVMPVTTVRARFLDFAPTGEWGERLYPQRRLQVSYAPRKPGPVTCP